MPVSMKASHDFPISIVILLIATSRSNAQLSVKADSIRSTVVDLSWNRIAGSPITGVRDEYRVFVSNIPSRSCGIASLSSQISISIQETSSGSHLRSRTSYFINVCAYWVNTTSENLREQENITLSTGPPAPNNVQVFSNQLTQLSVRWNDNDVSISNPVENYRVFYGAQQATSMSQEATISNLQTNTEYNIRVESLTNDTIISSDESVAILGITLPDKANTPKLVIATISSIALEWEAVNEGSVARIYEIVWRATGNSSTITRTIRQTSFTLTNLLSNTAYEIAVTASNAAGVGETSEQATFRTVPAKPNAPSRQSSTDSSITLQWNPINEGSVQRRYIVTWRVPGNTSFSRTTFDTVITISGLESNTAYDVTITARNDAGNSVPSDQVTFNTVPAKANSPNRISSTIASIDVRWDPVNEGPLQRAYLVTWTVSGSGPTFSRTVDGTFTTLSGLQSNTAYDVTIAARNSAGFGELSNVVTLLTVPAKANAPTRIASTTTTIRMRWDPVIEGSVERTYVLTWVSTSNSGSPSSTATTGAVVTISGLASNTAYDVTVRAQNDAGAGEASNQVTFITVPAKVNTPTRVLSTTTSIELRWNPVNEGSVARTYDITWVASGFGMQGSRSTTGSTLVITDLQSNTNYDFTIIARNDAGQSQSSDLTTFTTAPGPPRNIMLDLLESNPTESILMMWNTPVGGDAISIFIVHWMSDDNVDQVSVSYNQSTSYTIVISNLIPGETYTVVVQVFNDVGSANSTLQTITTNPEQVLGLTLSQNTTSPSRGIIVSWNAEIGKGDYISLNWTGEPSGMTETRNLSFADQVVDVAVIPGNNWTIVVTVHSSGRISEIAEGRVSSKPDAPVFSVTPFSDAIELSWPSLDGYAATIFAKLTLGNEVVGDVNLDSNLTSYRFVDVLSFTPYAIEMYSAIIDVQGEEERSNLTTGDVMTLPGVPQVLDAVTGVALEQTSSNKVTLVLSESTFSTRNGPIENYAVYVEAVQFSIGNTTPDVTRNVSCVAAAVARMSECVALWTDCNGIPSALGGICHRRTPKTTNIQFTVGASQVSYSPWGQTFYDYPLDLQTVYRVAIAAKTSNDKMSATNWQVVNLGGAPRNDLAWVAALVIVFVGAVAFMVGGYFHLRSRKKPNTSRSRPPATTQTRFNVGSRGFTNVAATDMQLESSARFSNKRIPINSFPLQFDLLQKDSGLQLTAQYQELSLVGKEQSTENALLPENRGKNRYTNILPYDATRVRLSSEGGNSDYINANYMPGNRGTHEYIAAQGPLPGTRDDFWRLVWEQNCHYIVMLTQTVERGRVKCDRYWPYDNDVTTVGALSLQMVKEIILPLWSIREFVVGYGTESRYVTQYNYTAWPDHGVPDTTADLVRFVQEIRRKIDTENRFGPILVHCSAGVGRTGTFIAMDRLLQGFFERTYIDIFGMVEEMRRNRSHMVQTESQYELIYQMVADILSGKFPLENSPDDENSRQDNSMPIYDDVASDTA